MSRLRSKALIHFFLICVFLHSYHTPALAFETPAIALWPRQHRCLLAGPAPEIDGVLRDSAWREIPWTEPFVAVAGDALREPRLRTRAKLMWDAAGIYFGIVMHEPQVWAEQDTEHRVGAGDNSITVYLDPDGDNLRGLVIQLDAAGRLQTALLATPHSQDPAAHLPWDRLDLQAAVHVDGSLNQPQDRDTGWTVEIAIPWAVIGELTARSSPPRIGDIWRVNIARVQWRTRAVADRYEKIVADGGRPLAPEIWVWSPQGLSALDYPEMWGELLFVDGPDLTFAEAPEHQDIAVANRLMPVYYLQRMWHQQHGQYAADLVELGIPPGEFPLWPPPPGRAPTTPLPYRWRLELNSTDDRFEARLQTPEVTATVDETGRLRRENRRSP